MTKVRFVYWPIARTTASMSALTKFSITVSAGAASFFWLPIERGGLLWATAGGTSGGSARLRPQRSAMRRASESPPARLVERPLVMSPTAEVQDCPIAVSPSQQRDEARQLCFHARIGSRQGLCAAGKA